MKHGVFSARVVFSTTGDNFANTRKFIPIAVSQTAYKINNAVVAIAVYDEDDKQVALAIKGEPDAEMRKLIDAEFGPDETEVVGA